MKLPRVLLAITSFWALVGCAIHYSDSKTGAEHVWGFGHLAIKATDANAHKIAVVRVVTLFGVGLGLRDSSPFLIIGWERLQTVEVVDENTDFLLQRPDSDLLKLRINSAADGSGIWRRGEP
jgi:hypothetical protein